VLALAIAGCGGSGVRPEAQRSEHASSKTARPLLPAAPSGLECGTGTGPRFCLERSTAGAYVIGLPLQHGWERGDRVVLEASLEGTESQRAVALTVVVQAYRDAARVEVLYQIAPELKALPARRVGREERARLEHYVGRAKALSAIAGYLQAHPGRAGRGSDAA
jgi:hypothetical protein